MRADEPLPDLEAFRSEVRSFLRENLPHDIRERVKRGCNDFTTAELRDWMAVLAHRGGWSCPNWPAEHGGPGWSHAQKYIFEREYALNHCPKLPNGGSAMLGPTLMHYGTREQKNRFLPDILTGKTFWAQGYSEPNAGSDLASLKCRADRDGNHYVINGSKIWTTGAHTSQWLFGLFRTDSSGRKQQGITFLMIKLSSPGITVRPLPMFEGSDELAEVFFDDVRVPVDQCVGEEHDGWNVSKYLLSLERFGAAHIGTTTARLDRVKELAATTPVGEASLLDDPVFANKLAQAEIELRALDVTEQRFLLGSSGAEAAMLKIRGTEVQQMVMELLVEVAGVHAQLAPDTGQEDRPRHAPAGAEYAAHGYFHFRKTPIWGGSNEIMRNIIAKAVLGL